MYIHVTWFFLFVCESSTFCCAVSSLLCVLFSSCSKRGLLSSCDVQVSHCCSCSCWLQALQASVVAARGLSSCGSQALEHSLSSCGTQALCCFPAYGIFLDQGLNPCLLYYQAESLPLSHQGSPWLFNRLFFLSGFRFTENTENSLVLPAPTEAQPPPLST